MLGPLKPYLGLLNRYRGTLYLGIFLGAVAGIASGAGVPFFIQKVFRTVFEDQQSGYSLGYLIGVAALLPAVFMVRGLAGYYNQYLMSACGIKVLLDVRRAVFDRLQRLPLKWFEDRHSGDLLARIVGDTSQMNYALMTLANEGVQNAFQVVGGIGALVFLSFQKKDIAFILLLLSMAPLIMWPVKRIGDHLKYRGRQLQASLGGVSESLSENLRASVEVRAFNLQDRERAAFEKQLDAAKHAELKVTKYDKLTQPLMEIIAVALVSAAFVYAYRAGIGYEDFAAMGVALYFAMDSVRRLIRAWNIVQRSQGAFERVDAIMNAEAEIEAPRDPVRMDRIEGRIAFAGVHFAYDEDPVFRGLNVDLAAGTVCGLVGPSGAGKSTFAKLVPRFYDVSAGEVTIDGVDVRRIELPVLRSAIAYVPQNPVLFSDTVMNNILLGRAGATREEAMQAARAANAHDFIEQLPLGYDTPVGENATRLSGGQRQRLALARAFLKDAPILILDEATSALDSESEARIQEALERLVKGRTVLIIAHRFSTLKLCDRVLVFEAGRIVASGRHDEVLADSPLYQQLHARQALA